MTILRSKYNLLLILSQLIIIPAFGITAKFSYTKVNNCAPALVQFTNTSSRGAGITYSWDFGLGAVVTATDYTVKEQLYTKAGKYRVKLKVTDGISTDTTSTLITIFIGPIANFTSDRINGCPPFAVKFTSTSVPGESQITSSLWDFRNGDSRQGTPVQYTYYSTGLFDVILTVTDKNGCSNSLESDNYISLTDKPKVNFAASDTFACSPPLNVSFTNLSTGSSVLTYRWDYGNGSSSTEMSNSTVYSSTGNYNVKLKATDQVGCTDSLIRKSYITIGYPKGTLSLYDGRNNLVTRSFICDGTYKFVCSVTGMPDYTWKITENNTTKTISGRNTLTYKVTGTGDINIKIVYGRNAYCTDSVSASYTKSYITAALSMSDTLFCTVPSKINLSNKSVNADKVSWYLSGQLISNLSTVSYTIAQKDIPALTYQQLYNHELNILKLPVKLVASNAGVCFDSVTSNITIIRPVARFLPDKVSGCIPLHVTLSDSSKSYYKINGFSYKVGSDSVVASTRSPASFIINKPGVYYAKEIIKSGICYDTSDVVKIVAGDKLRPDFTVTPAEVCNGGSIHLSGGTENSSAVNLWRFRSARLFDISSSSGSDTTISVISDTTGFKDVNLQVNYNGCLSDTTKHNIFKIKGPAGNLITRFTCDSPLVYHFKSTMTPFTSRKWNIDTAVVNDVDSVRYRFPKIGDYIAKLTATDTIAGCSLTQSKLIKVRQVFAAFSVKDTIFCAGDTVHFDGTPSIDYIHTCYNEGFLWDFGDKSALKRTFLTSYDHIYTSRGTDTVKLVVTADNGCLDTTKKVIHISKPAGSFTSDKTSACLPSSTVNFVNTSTDSTIVSWLWNFGDKSFDHTNSINTAHTYTSTKQTTWYPSLTIYDAYQCSSTYSRPFALKGVNTNFQANDNAICIGQTVIFKPADSTLNTISWTFGDGSARAATNTHTYTKQGTFSVTMAASNGSCRDSLVKTNYISVEKADANFTASDSIFYCYPDTVKFIHNNTIGSPGVDFLWKFGAYTLTDRSSSTVKYAFTKHGTYLSRLTVKTLNGCTASKSKNIVINGPAAAISVTPQKICYNQSITFRLDSLSNINSFKWYFGDGTTSTSNPVTHKYTSRGKLVPLVQLVNGTCTATNVLDTVTVSKLQAAFISSDSTLVLCLGKKLNLVNRSLYSDSWSWYNENVLFSTDFNVNNLLIPKAGDYNIKLIAKETGGCADTVIKKFTVAPYPAFTIDGDSIVCADLTPLVLSVNKDAGSLIRWTPATGLSSTNSFSVSALPATITTYTATVTNSYGCATSVKKKIMVNRPFDLTRSPLGDTSIYLGEKVQLKIMTAAINTTYRWSPRYNISCLGCFDPWVNPERSLTYSVETKNGCFDFTEQFNVNVIADYYLQAPTAFTPNGDSHNDVFKFESKNIKEFELKIFNRWGEIVFSTNDINNGWDGYVNGHPQNIDTYIYKVKAETIHGYIIEKKGEFLLLK